MGARGCSRHADGSVGVNRITSGFAAYPVTLRVVARRVWRRRRADSRGPELDTRLILDGHLGDPQNQRRELGRRHCGAHASEPERDVVDDLAHARGTSLVGRERGGLFSAAVWHGGDPR
jgi:hypothetical protein